MNRIARKACIASFAALLFSPVAGAFAATTTVLNPGDGGWTVGDTRDASGVNVNPAPGRVDLDVASPIVGPTNRNTLRLVTDTGSSKATLHQTSVSLGTIADFSGSY